MTRSSRALIAVFAVASLLVAPGAMARNVYVNGVDVETLRNFDFKNVNVHIDGNGDLHIDAPGYKVQMVEPDAPPGPAAAPTLREEAGANPELRSHYFLVTRPSPGGRAQYDFVVSVNGVERKVIPANAGQVILEISAWLRKGENRIDVTARKNLDGGRQSVSTSDEAQLVVGSGHVEDNKVKVDVVHGTVTVNASQIQDVKKGFNLNAI